ncbi:MAG: hypothetical protein Q7J35_03165 [Candidatus Methanoperedens sp.]|nr:hypothetical protein [Candidatus Methanoperedens sp.]
MKIIGKIMLFFSSYFLLFLVLLLSEIDNYLKPDATKIPIIGTITIYIILILASLFSILIFKKNFAFGSIKSKNIISIKSVSSGSQDYISYLITMVIPLLGTNSLSLFVSLNNWVKVLTMLIIIFFILILYINTNLVVINPMLVLFGYSIHKINFCYEDTEIEFEGVLLSDKKLALTSIYGKTIVDKIDENTFIIRRI